MAIINVDRPTDSVTNNSKPSIGVTWALIETTWATETDSWREVSQLLENVTRVTSTITNTNKPA